MLGVVGVQIGVERGQGEKKQGHGEDQRPDHLRRADGAFMDVAFGLEGQPEGAVHAENQHEEDAAREAVGVQKLDDVAVVHAVAVDRDAHEQVGEGHAEQQRGQEVAEELAGVPELAPLGAILLVAELEGHRAEDQGEEQDEQRSVERAEHHRVGLGEGGEGHAAGRDEPHFVAVPVGAGSVVDDAFFFIVLGEERQQGPHAEVEAVQDKVDRPEQSPQNKPSGFKHIGNPLLG